MNYNFTKSKLPVFNQFILFFFIGFLIPFKSISTEKLSELATDPSLELISQEALGQDYNEIFYLTRFLTTKKEIIKFLKESFPQLTAIAPEDSSELNTEKESLKTVPEHIFISALREDTDLLNFVRKIEKEYSHLLNTGETEPLKIVFDKYKPQFIEIFVPKIEKKIKKYGTESTLRPISLVVPNVENSGSITAYELFSSTPRINRGKKIGGNDLIKVVIDFISSAKKELILNVFDFDVVEIADALIQAIQRGIEVRVGVDKNVIHERPQVQTVFDKLKSFVKNEQLEGRCLNCKIHAVDSTSLNHQKLIALDWSIEGAGRVLTSSGNFTYSGINKNGDISDQALKSILKELETESGLKIPNKQRKQIAETIALLREKKSDGIYTKAEKKWFFEEIRKISLTIDGAEQLLDQHHRKISDLMNLSIPNSNHIITYNSDSFAQLVNHELTKTIDLELRGRSGDKAYPYSGIFKIPFVSSEHYALVSFSPNGGYGKINDIIANLIRYSKGDIDMMQFAFSSPKVAEALEIAVFSDKRKLRALGEGPFAMSYWSIFLRLIGLERPNVQEKKDGIPDFYYIADYLYNDTPEIQQLRDSLRIAPDIFGTSSVRLLETSVPLTSKLHHKVISINGHLSTPGTSHNFSKGALSNQEQFVIVNHPEITAYINSIFDYLYSQTSLRDSVARNAISRNKWRIRDGLKPSEKVFLGPLDQCDKNLR